MTLGACIMEESAQSEDETCTVALDESTRYNQPLPTEQTIQTIVIHPSQREQKRKAYYYNHLEPKARNRIRQNNKPNRKGQRSLGYEGHDKSHHSVKETWNTLPSHNAHAQCSFNEASSSQQPFGGLYSKKVVQVTKTYYYIDPELAKSAAVPATYGGPPHVPWARAATEFAPYSVEVQTATQLSTASKEPFAQQSPYARVLTPRAEPGFPSQALPHPPQYMPFSAVMQQEASLNDPRTNALFGTRSGRIDFPHVGVSIAPVGTPRSKPLAHKTSSSVGWPEPDMYGYDVEPGLLKRTQTHPSFLQASKSI